MVFVSNKNFSIKITQMLISVEDLQKQVLIKLLQSIYTAGFALAAASAAALSAAALSAAALAATAASSAFLASAAAAASSAAFC